MYKCTKIPQIMEVIALTGEYNHSLDAKGRLFVPAKLRERLGEEFFVTISMDTCLSIYSAENWKNFSDRVNAMSYVDQRKMRPLFVYASRLELDSQGRVLVPQNLRAFAKLIKNVTIVGCNNHVELWDSEQWKAIAEAEINPENIAAVMKELMI